jgi:hypothetical protein
MDIKKFMFTVFLVISVLGAIFAYILFTQGAFDSRPVPSALKPFEMKCEAGKCASGKCGANK